MATLKPTLSASSPVPPSSHSHALSLTLLSASLCVMTACTPQAEQAEQTEQAEQAEQAERDMTIAQGGELDAEPNPELDAEPNPELDAEPNPELDAEPYCRSLDPAWREHYVGDELDEALAAQIEARGLEGDPQVYVDAEGRCVRRELPSIHEPVAQLGRALFFSKELSGDRDVACATCHHPLLGGGDALSVSVGPVHFDLTREDAMGADRVRGLTDITALKVGRNAPTTFNIAFWDHGLFWDARVESLSRERRPNGEGAPLSTPESASPLSPDPLAGENLTVAQARFPLVERHEMAGSWADLYEGDPEGLRAALSARLATSPEWVERFEALCAHSERLDELPPSWRRACITPEGSERDAALTQMPHVVFAIGEYERSQVFTDTPWRRYVQGERGALTLNEKKGAQLFFTSRAEGGLGCADCHSGDLFSDERAHAVGAPQIGPGKGAGVTGLGDLGRSGVTQRDADAHRFRTPTLLNVEVTAPYFHSGAYGSLRKAIEHYDHQQGRVLEYFGEHNKSDTNTRPWCRMAQFASLPDCRDLYTAEETVATTVESGLDPLADLLRPRAEGRSALLVAFLSALTDPRVKNPEALTPWIEPSSPLTVTTSSDEWGTICDAQIERSATINAHLMGLRWLLRGGSPEGVDVSDDEIYADFFGVKYWELLEVEFTAFSGVSQRSSNLAALTLELMSPEQRQLLYQVYERLEERAHYEQWLQMRRNLLNALDRKRLGALVTDEELAQDMSFAASLELDDVIDIAALYRSLRALEGAPGSQERAEREALWRVARRGELSALSSALPPEFYSTQLDLDRGRINVGERVSAEEGWRTLRRGSLPWEPFVAGYLTSFEAPLCARSFIPRLGDGERRANLFSYGPWAQRYLFDLNTGREGSGGLQEELSNWMSALDERLGLAELFDETLDVIIEERKAYEEARAELTSALVRLESAPPAGEEEQRSRETLRLAQQRISEADHQLLSAHVRYYLQLLGALNEAEDDSLERYLACLESAETQATRGAGGLGSLSACEPPADQGGAP